MANETEGTEAGGNTEPTSTAGVSGYVPDIEIAPSRIPLFYQFGLVLVTGAMMLLRRPVNKPIYLN